MPLFWTDSLALCYSNLLAAKQWWLETFDCKEAKVPHDWDCTLPSDVALKLPGHDVPTLLLSDSTEVRKAGYERSHDHPIIFRSKLTKAQEYLQRRGVLTGGIQDSGGTEFFEVRDPEGNVIEICKEP
jgi:hypothetical protein